MYMIMTAAKQIQMTPSRVSFATARQNYKKNLYYQPCWLFLNLIKSVTVTESASPTSRADIINRIGCGA